MRDLCTGYFAGAVCPYRFFATHKAVYWSRSALQARTRSSVKHGQPV
jgi:hypothetical protein